MSLLLTRHDHEPPTTLYLPALPLRAPSAPDAGREEPRGGIDGDRSEEQTCGILENLALRQGPVAAAWRRENLGIDDHQRLSRRGLLQPTADALLAVRSRARPYLDQVHGRTSLWRDTQPHLHSRRRDEAQA